MSFAFAEPPDDADPAFERFCEARQLDVDQETSWDAYEAWLEDVEIESAELEHAARLEDSDE